jgi:hypothetical protein
LYPSSNTPERKVAAMPKDTGITKTEGAMVTITGDGIHYFQLLAFADG